MINKINKLPKSEFIKVFANIFENARWIAEELHNQKPFDDFEELSSKILNIFGTSTKEKQLKILNAHPDLANKTKISLLTPDSLKEQTSAGLDQCTEEEFSEFKKLNNTYKKFGFALKVGRREDKFCFSIEVGGDSMEHLRGFGSMECCGGFALIECGKADRTDSLHNNKKEQLP